MSGIERYQVRVSGKVLEGHVKMFGTYSIASGELASLSKEEGAICEPMFRKTSLLVAWRADWRWDKLETGLPKALWVPGVALWTCSFLVLGCMVKGGTQGRCPSSSLPSTRQKSMSLVMTVLTKALTEHPGHTSPRSLSWYLRERLGLTMIQILLNSG